MMKKTALTRLGAATLALALASCASLDANQSNEPIAFTSLFSSAMCGQPDQAVSAHALPNYDEWAEFKGQIKAPTKGLDDITETNFQPMVYFSWGQKTSGGYALSLDEKNSGLKMDGDSSILELSLELKTPPKGGMSIMMMTQPCIAVSHTAEKYDVLRVKDQNGAELINLETPN